MERRPRDVNTDALLLIESHLRTIKTMLAWWLIVSVFGAALAYLMSLMPSKP